jgi:hypothetical protein
LLGRVHPVDLRALDGREDRVEDDLSRSLPADPQGGLPHGEIRIAHRGGDGAVGRGPSEQPEGADRPGPRRWVRVLEASAHEGHGDGRGERLQMAEELAEELGRGSRENRAQRLRLRRGAGGDHLEHAAPRGGLLELEEGFDQGLVGVRLEVAEKLEGFAGLARLGGGLEAGEEGANARRRPEMASHLDGEETLARGRTSRDGPERAEPPGLQEFVEQGENETPRRRRREAGILLEARDEAPIEALGELGLPVEGREPARRLERAPVPGDGAARSEQRVQAHPTVLRGGGLVEGARHPRHLRAEAPKLLVDQHVALFGRARVHQLHVEKVDDGVGEPRDRRAPQQGDEVLAEEALTLWVAAELGHHAPEIGRRDRRGELEALNRAPKQREGEALDPVGVDVDGLASKEPSIFGDGDDQGAPRAGHRLERGVRPLDVALEDGVAGRIQPTSLHRAHEQPRPFTHLGHVVRGLARSGEGIG